ncbi:hypothetical protein OG689_04140 [Kitasatospora sp. NBC_00240]|uniref:hypothetical protein n=1 Tax=Kitasatospora sp. NBC_00240 TaxID=2903567 RepID=UPI00225959C9|nr:hypothetical protein [Kitasatospora sp. NBC_00240]MCX5208492.1 hypothetical protein [Kitasatospora sp. NBC_00240]
MDDRMAPVDTLPASPRPFPVPIPDPRSRTIAPDYAGMEALVRALVLPARASMQVMSALETSRELVRHSYHRYEFATVAVTHSLYALEHVLAERLDVAEPLEGLIERAADAGLLAVELAAELDRGRVVRDRLAHGAASSAALNPVRAVKMLENVFAAVALLLRPASTAGPAAAGTTATQADELLARLREDHCRAPFPVGFVGVDLASVELVLLDADVAVLVRQELAGGLDDDGIALLWSCIAGLDKIMPLINEEYCASYFARLRRMAGLAASRHIPAAT